MKGFIKEPNGIDLGYSRRTFLQNSGFGFGAVAFSALTNDASILVNSGHALETIPHKRGQAKNVIFLFMEGGPSHLDLFDPKPLLNKLAGQSLPDSFEKPVTAMGESNSPLLESKRSWKQHGQGGLWISDWLPNISKISDELCVIRSCIADGINHAGGVCQMNTGSVFGGRPSLGAWVSYGLGSENKNLPSFVVLKDSNGMVVNGVRNWGNGFLPASYQGALFGSDNEPIPNLSPFNQISPSRLERKLKLLNTLNQSHLHEKLDIGELEARIHSYEMAFNMQKHAPEAVDFSQEPEYIRELYGANDNKTKVMAQNCILARRLVERGVRFVQVYHGTGSRWDSHDNIEPNHARQCREMDKPVAALVTDLKQRGLLDDTLVIWGGEFGRTPMSEKGDGRDHNPTGFTIWMTGAGIPGGTTIGETDDLGLHAVSNKAHVHDIHATILNLLGVDHTKLTFSHKGLPERIDQNEGHIIPGLAPRS